MSRRNGAPAHVWEALRRLRACNKTELAKALGITPRTLKRWTDLSEAGDSPGASAEQKASELMIATLRAAKNADVHAQWRINRENIETIGKRR